MNVIKNLEDNSLTVRLIGAVTENVKFEHLIGEVPNQVVVNCREVPMINSEGIKAWIRYFTGLYKQGVDLHFTECTTSIVEQINAIINFIPGGKVDSVFVPFACKHCKSELVALLNTSDIKRLNCLIPPQKCTKCGGEAIFDDIEDEYFMFIKR